MIRILYVMDSLMAGGIESQMVELLSRLDRTRYEPHVLALYGPTARTLHFAPALRKLDVPLILPDLGWGARDKVRGWQIIRQSAQRLQPQFVHAEGYHANLLTRVAAPFFPRNTRVVGAVRGLLTARQLRYEQLTQQTCAAIIVNAPHLQRQLEINAGIPSAKIVHIPNGIPIERYQAPHDSTLRQRLAPGASRVFVALGRINAEKNPQWYAEAFGRLKQAGELTEDIRAFWAGAPQDESIQQAFTAAIARDQLAEQVIQLPASSHPEDLYHMGDAVVVFSPAYPDDLDMVALKAGKIIPAKPGEGLPNVIIEALAAGRPVVVSEIANAADVITDGVNGWVVRNNDVAALAVTLKRIIAMSDSSHSAMQDACRKRAADYSVERYVAATCAVYDRLMAKGSSGAGRSPIPEAVTNR